MTVYYQTRELIILNHLVPTKQAGANLQTRIIRQVGGGVKTIYDAHEIWTYNPATRRFDAYKNKSGTTTLLKTFLANKGIHIRPDAASIHDARVTACRFVDDKDHFLFKLKFGE